MKRSSQAATAVIGVGAQTAIGRSVWSSAAAVRAGISGFCMHPLAKDAQGQPFQIAMCDWLEPSLHGVDRLEALLLPAIEEASDGLTDEGGVSLLLCLSPERPGMTTSSIDDLAERLRARFRDWLQEVEVVPGGHAAGLLGLQIASARLANGTAGRCMVAAVDSYLSPAILSDLEAKGQAHGSGPTNNAWGFVPGEGAAALMLAAIDRARSRGDRVLASVLGIGRSFEPMRIRSGSVCIGEGLARALSQALSGQPSTLQLDAVYCDINGEPYRSDEYGFAVLRLPHALGTASDFVAPADCWGDVGTVSSLLGVALASTRFAKRLAVRPQALVWGSSEGGERAAVLLARED